MHVRVRNTTRLDYLISQEASNYAIKCEIDLTHFLWRRELGTVLQQLHISFEGSSQILISTGLMFFIFIFFL